MGYRVAVVGATGNVGREMLNILAERKFPASEVIALASSRSQGQEISFGDKRPEGAEPREFRFHRRRFRADVGRLADRQGIGREDRRAPARIVVDNSELLALPRRCAAGGARGERAMCSTPTWRATTARTSSPIPTARRRSWWWR